MKFCVRLLCLLLCGVMFVAFVGCGDKHREKYLYFEFSEKPYTLDAQTASSDTELMLVRNIYEGLMRYNADGELVCGAAESYKKDGLTYTFTLRKDIKWSTGEPLYADDFVFGIVRAVSPQTAAPFVSRLFSIRGASEVNSGRAGLSSLGVRAVDDRTVEITLVREDEYFLDTLASSVCMPCNEEFFGECVGKYGLESKYIISNGSYSIRKWAKDDNFGIRLYSNDEYNGNFVAENAAVYFSCRKDLEPVELVANSKVDMAFIDSTKLSDAADANIHLETIPNICWMMSVGNNFSDNVRLAFAKLIGSDIYADSLPSGFSPAYSIYPEIISGTENLDGLGIAQYDLASAQQIFSAAVKGMENKRLPPTVLTYYDDPCIKDALTDIVGHWQQQLSAFINIEASSSLAALTSQLNGKTMPFAVFPVTAANSNAAEYLLKFGVNTGDAASAQSSLLSSNRLIPIAYENTTIAVADTLESYVVFKSGGYIDFSFIIKKG